MSRVRKPFVLATYDTSLGAGRFSSDWVPTLNQQARTYPEAVGPFKILNFGHGGWTSNDLLAGVNDVIKLQPTHVWTELGAINDCVDFGGGPAVSLATKNANNLSMLNQIIAGVPGVDITVMTMSSVSVSQTARTTLATYYAAEMTLAAGLGLRTLDLYAGWPKPLDSSLTYGATPFVSNPGNVAGLVDGCTFDPTHAGSNIILSGDLFEGQVATDGDGVVLGTQPFVGVQHFEVLIGNNTAGGRPYIGAAAHGINVNRLLGSEAYGVGIDAGGGVSGGPGGSVPFSFLKGDVVGVDLDYPNHRIRWTKGAVVSAWFDITTVCSFGPVYPAVGFYYTNTWFSGHFNVDGDGLHPLWPAVSQYSYPSWVALVRSLMAAYWPN